MISQHAVSGAGLEVCDRRIRSKSFRNVLISVNAFFLNLRVHHAFKSTRIIFGGVSKAPTTTCMWFVRQLTAWQVHIRRSLVSRIWISTSCRSFWFRIFAAYFKFAVASSSRTESGIRHPLWHSIQPRFSQGSRLASDELLTICVFGLNSANLAGHTMDLSWFCPS